MTPDTYPTLLQSANTLVAQAQTVATQDFAAARALWRQAGALFLRAHQADPTQHAAALRLGQASMAEAHALQKEGSEDAVAMWRQAAVQCEAAFALDRSTPPRPSWWPAPMPGRKTRRPRRPGRRSPGI